MKGELMFAIYELFLSPFHVQIVLDTIRRNQLHITLTLLGFVLWHFVCAVTDSRY